MWGWFDCSVLCFYGFITIVRGFGFVRVDCLGCLFYLLFAFVGFGWVFL